MSIATHNTFTALGIKLECSFQCGYFVNNNLSIWKEDNYHEDKCEYSFYHRNNGFNYCLETLCVVKKSGGNIISFYIDERVEYSALYFIILCFYKLFFGIS